ncbi:MAG: hypothetical protein H6822_01255 [Planctomycetaceae bacterium]|nr:hypothetical protein [Planctomycetales bacterium]MCB9920773.1 hypothetical protein [Planctomycetaceae bacterium]
MIARTSVFNLLLVMMGFAIPILGVPAIRNMEETRQRAQQDIDPRRGELLFFTADW